MKHLHKALALILALAMVMSLGITAFAAAPEYSITITNDPAKTNVTIKGNTYTAYKLFDVTMADGTDGAVQKYSYTVADEFKTFKLSDVEAKAIDPNFAGREGVNAENVIEFVSGLTGAEVNAFAEAVYKWTGRNGLQNSSSTCQSTSKVEKVVIDCGKSGPGYYLVYGEAEATDGTTGKLTSALILDTTNPKPTVEAKVDAPTIEKTENDGKIDDTVQIGDTVNFQLKSKVPGMEGFETYTMTFKDTLSSGLTLCSSNGFKLTIGGNPVSLETCTVTELEAKKTGAWLAIDGNSFILKLADLTKTTGNVNPKTEDPIVVTYSAVVNDKALTSNVETNKATLTYSNDPTKEDSNSTTPEEKTRVFDFAVDVLKVEAGNKAIKLKDAEFKLFKDDSYAAGSTDLPNDQNAKYYQYKKEGGIAWVAEKDADIRVTNENGNLCLNDGSYTPKPFGGLDEGTYFLKETKAPSGYNLLKYPVRVKIAAVHPDGDPNTITGVTYTFATYDESKNAFVDGAPVEVAIDETATNKLIQTVTVENSTGNELPSTGGIGTTIFYTVGAIMMVSALVLLITKKKMSAN